MKGVDDLGEFPMMQISVADDQHSSRMSIYAWLESSAIELILMSGRTTLSISL